eukprot:TRINITY_DN920_c0_g1_i9.p1 TRINITY_DN920_c0_g1~~TRINITY_DN920_c0_g1_i9.p1  ORF type:complete len:621 (+),score=230.48 TRINITY_DN920_c0_g1_i9:400-2262(+)
MVEDLGITKRAGKQTKFIVVTGGVLSGIGKGVTASSIGVLVKMMGMRPTAIKIDPYLNVDAGTMSPFEHGEVFVLDDGGETDLDLGNYERFMDVSLKNESNLTTGKVYQTVIERERRGDYLGKTVQVVPHVTDALQDWIVDVSSRCVDGSGKAPDVCIIELGGTLGDIESMPFVEALRQLQARVGYKNMCFVHVSLVPTVGGEPGEQKTKPTQHSVKQMRELGLAPDFLMCRGRSPLEDGSRRKLSMFCQVPGPCVMSVHDVSNIYRVPLLLLEQGFPTLLAQRLRLDGRHQSQCEGDGWCGNPKATTRLDKKQLKAWQELAATHDSVSDEVRIALVGKYTDLHDTYLSVVKALLHASLAHRQRLHVEWIDSTALEGGAKGGPEAAAAWQQLRSCDGVLVPGGFGERGLEGKIAAIREAREGGVPFLGICLGMQAAVIEYARTVLGVEGANSAEFAPALDDTQRVVVFMPEGSRDRMGGTMRLGARETRIDAGSLAHELYGGASKVDERHRHRYEVNPDAVPALEGAGLRFVGRNSDGTGERMEVIELPRETHPFFIAAQYHPEFKSRPSKPAPLFMGLMRAAGARAAARREQERQQETVEEAVEDGISAVDAPEAAPSA